MPLPVEMTTIDRLFRVGPTHHRIGHLQSNEPIGAFELHEVVDARDAAGSDRALWKADNQTQRRLKVRPTHKGVAPAGIGTDSLRNRMRSFKSILFYARNMRWTSQALLAATTPNPVMGGRAWTSLGHEDARVQKAFALWSNSTLGMMIHWTQGQRTQIGRSTVQINALKAIPCPRLDQRPDAALDKAAENFDRLSTRELRPACQAHADPARSEIDEAVIQMLGLGSAAAEEIRKTLSIMVRGTFGAWRKQESSTPFGVIYKQILRIFNLIVVKVFCCLIAFTCDCEQASISILDLSFDISLLL